MSPMREIHLDEEEPEKELRVSFYPELYLQRRIWILDILRRENIKKILDVGCGEGQLLSPLCQPAPWLAPPPTDLLPPQTPDSPQILVSPGFQAAHDADSIPNLHASLIHGLDISPNDLAFAIDATRPPAPLEDLPEFFRDPLTRFELLEVKLWEGGLETINEEFVGIECIVSTEVIEHLTPAIYPFFAPMLLGVYHPEHLLVTTPSYTFNARFTSPDAPTSVRKGYRDPTKRTDRVFRHSDHKFEWTREEFEEWVDQTAKEWGYEAFQTSIGRSTERDPYGRDTELGGASFVVEFRKMEPSTSLTDDQREKRGRETVAGLVRANGELNVSPPHKLAAHHTHPAHASSQKPKTLSEIAVIVKAEMESKRESLMDINQLWFNQEVATACGGWIEFLLRAVEESQELTLKKEENGILQQRDSWIVETVGGTGVYRNLWLDTSVGSEAVEHEGVPEDWTPGQGPLHSYDSTDFGESTGVEGDISVNGSEDESETGGTWQTYAEFAENSSAEAGWGVRRQSGGGWGEALGGGDWGSVEGDKSNNSSSGDESSEATKPHLPVVHSGAKKSKYVASSTAGWDGDEDASDSTTS